MTIYRVQNKEGRGPFQPGLSAKWLDENPKDHEAKLVAWPEQFPAAFFTIRTFRRIYCGCGCESPDQLKLWFSPSEIQKMSAFGLRPVKLEVDEILQLVFRRLKPLHEDAEPFDLY